MKDLFGDVYDIFKPHFEKFEKMHEDLKHNIQKGIIEEMMDAKTMSELDAIKAFNSEYFDMWSTELSLHYESAANRIKGLFKVQVDAWGLPQLN